MENAISNNPSVKGNEIKFIGWGHYDFEVARKEEKGNKPKSQTDYFSALRERSNCAGIIDRIEELVVSEIVRNKFRFDGDSHQNYKYGCPIVEVDGETMYYSVSWRHWGSIMADAWTKIDGKAYDYMDFYMGITQVDADFRGPIVGYHIDENGRSICPEVSDGIRNVIENLYAEKQKLNDENSSMRHALWGCRKIFRGIDEEKSSDLFYKAFGDDVSLFCRNPEDRSKIDMGKALKASFDKWVELNENVNKHTEMFERIERQVKEAFAKKED